MITQQHDIIRQNTADAVNTEIERATEANVHRFQGAPANQIADRIEALDNEWDVDRALMATASTLSLVGITLGATTDRRWYGLSGVVASFLLLHAIEGWCPPLPVFRRLGYRSRQEIDTEKNALKSLRGDFGQPQSATEALSNAR